MMRRTPHVAQGTGGNIVACNWLRKPSTRRNSSKINVGVNYEYRLTRNIGRYQDLFGTPILTASLASRSAGVSANLTFSDPEFQELSEGKAFSLPSNRGGREQRVSAQSGIAGLIGIVVVVGILGLSIYLAWIYLI
jgi:hypothetical protein